MKPIVKNLLTLAIASALSVPGAAFATNGTFVPGFGAKSVGMGGVGIAYAQDSFASGANPAGIADVGTRVDISLEAFNPERRSAMYNGPGGYDSSAYGFAGDSWSKNRYYPLPNMGMAMAWDDKFSIGIAALAAGGMGTAYTQNFFDPKNLPLARASRLIGGELFQLQMPLTLSWRMNDEHAFGASLIFGRQRFAIRGLEAFTFFDVVSPADTNQFTNKGYDYSNGYGYRVGWRGKFFDERVTLGATYASRMEYGKFKTYKGLFADQGEFDQPDNYGFGIALKPTENLTLAMDWQRINFSSVSAIGNRGPDTVSIPALADKTTQTGKPNGMGFGWTDQIVLKYGVDWKVNSKWNVRAGYNFGKSPIPNDQLTFNSLFPAITEKHATVGFTYNIDDESEVTMSYLHAFRHKQSGCGFQFVDCVEIEMFQRSLGIAYALKW